MKITRTITGTRARVIVVDTQSLKADEKEFIIPDTFDNIDKLLKALKKNYDNSEQILSAVMNTEKFEELYGLDESVFMKYAVKLDPKTRKPLTDKVSESEPHAENTESEPQVEPQADSNDGLAITAPVTITSVSAKAEKINTKNKNK